MEQEKLLRGRRQDRWNYRCQGGWIRRCCRAHPGTRNHSFELANLRIMKRGLPEILERNLFQKQQA
ncbi:MAG: hypothetical protein J7J76_04920 [Candidatus Latescibacteria bacterium]|nr:hypothetical protein [Candidatus Latescibacterota bacterium]